MSFVLKTIEISVIKVYQATLSLDHSPIWKHSGLKACRHYPSCSQYTIEAIEKYGVGKGSFLGAKRISKCHPWGTHGYDPVE